MIDETLGFLWLWKEHVKRYICQQVNASHEKKSSRLSCFGKLLGIQLVKLSFEDMKM